MELEFVEKIQFNLFVEEEEYKFWSKRLMEMGSDNQQ